MDEFIELVLNLMCYAIFPMLLMLVGAGLWEWVLTTIPPLGR